MSEQTFSPVYISPVSNKENCCPYHSKEGRFANHPKDFLSSQSAPSLQAFGQGGTSGKPESGWERCLERGQHPHLPCDPSRTGSISHFLTWMKPRASLCVSLFQQGREKGGAFYFAQHLDCPSAARGCVGRWPSFPFIYQMEKLRHGTNSALPSAA